MAEHMSYEEAAANAQRVQAQVPKTYAAARKLGWTITQWFEARNAERAALAAQAEGNDR